MTDKTKAETYPCQSDERSLKTRRPVMACVCLLARS